MRKYKNEIDEDTELNDKLTGWFQKNRYNVETLAAFRATIYMLDNNYIASHISKDAFDLYLTLMANKWDAKTAAEKFGMMTYDEYADKIMKEDSDLLRKTRVEEERKKNPGVPLEEIEKLVDAEILAETEDEYKQIVWSAVDALPDDPDQLRDIIAIAEAKLDQLGESADE